MEELIAQITTTGTKIEKRPQLGLDLLLLEGRADGKALGDYLDRGEI